MRKKCVPDWAFKAFLAFAMAIFAAGLARWVYDALADSQYIARSGTLVTAATNPARFASRVAGAAFATMLMLTGTLACLGWIPAVGRLYKRWLRRCASIQDSGPHGDRE